MDFKKLTTRFWQFGGFRLLGEYAKLGAILPAVRTAWWFTVHGEWFKDGLFQCCKDIYGSVILKKVEPFLERKYAPVVHEFKSSRVQDQELENSRINSTNTDSTNHTDRHIWFCWLQGMEDAPDIVKACYNSLERHLVQGSRFTDQGYRLEVIDNSNWKEFVELPEYVVRKWEKGRKRSF